MAMTKVEAAKLTQDMLVRGVIDTVVKESQILTMLPFMEVQGSAVAYNREASMAAAGFYDVGDTWNEGTPTFTKVTVPLRILGGDADVDNFLQATYSDVNDIEAVVVANRAKSVAHKFSDAFFNGDTAVDAKSFDGLTKLIPAGQQVSMGANGGALTLDKLDEAIDLVKPGKPDALFMSKRTRRKLSSLRRASGNLLETDVDAFGQRALYYDGIPVIVDDFVSDAQTQGNVATCSSIYAVKMGMGVGVMGIEQGGIQVERVGELEQKDATRTRIKWYAALALFSELGCSRLLGITA